jgi:hypothetical protein
MSVQITHVRYGSTPKTEATIVRYKWVEDGTGKVDDSDKPTMVDWIDNKNGKAFVGSGAQRVNVGVWHPSSGQPWLQTYADNHWTNNLTSLDEL